MPGTWYQGDSAGDGDGRTGRYPRHSGGHGCSPRSFHIAPAPAVVLWRQNSGGGQWTGTGAGAGSGRHPGIGDGRTIGDGDGSSGGSGRCGKYPWSTHGPPSRVTTRPSAVAKLASTSSTSCGRHGARTASGD